MTSLIFKMGKPSFLYSDLEGAFPLNTFAISSKDLIGELEGRLFISFYSPRN